jgi:hypothetical protein
MQWPLHYHEEFCSALPPAELLRLLKNRLLAINAPVWRDDFQPTDDALFQGNAEGNSFTVLRLRKHPVYREAGPFPIRGQVSPHQHGSVVRLVYYLPLSALHLVIFQAVLVSALILCGTIPAWYTFHKFPWFSILLLSLLPFSLAASTYFSLYQEAAKSRPLLIELLALRS